jgi:hypothetical protein
MSSAAEQRRSFLWSPLQRRVDLAMLNKLTGCKTNVLRDLSEKDG